MPILNGFQATERVRELEAAGPLPDQQHKLSHQLNGRIPIFAVSASLKEDMKERMCQYGLDGWILKPLDFKRLTKLMEGITDTEQRAKDLYSHESNWERGGWLTEPAEKQKDFAA
jgi:CheY-like chemotaxis protein